jgi:hypothetical protein
VIFSEFNKIDNSSFNFLFKSLPVLTEIKSSLMLLFSVSSSQGLEQHLYPLNVFPSLSLFNSQPSTIDSPTNSTDTFENLLLYFVYGSSSFSSLSASPYNTFTVTTTSQEEFEVFSKLCSCILLLLFILLCIMLTNRKVILTDEYLASVKQSSLTKRIVS